MMAVVRLTRPCSVSASLHLAFAPCCEADSVWVLMTVHSVSPSCLEASRPCHPPAPRVPVTTVQTDSADGRPAAAPRCPAESAFLRPGGLQKLCRPVFVCLFVELRFNLSSSEPRASEAQNGGQEVFFCVCGKIHFLKGTDQTRSFG